MSVGTKSVPVGPSLGKPSASADGVRDRRPPSPSEEVCESAWAGKAFELGRHRPVLQRAGAAEAVAVAAPVAVEAAGGHVGPQPMQRGPRGELSAGSLHPPCCQSCGDGRRVACSQIRRETKMGGGGVEGRGRFWRSGPACEAPAVGIRTNIPSQGSPPSAGGGPYAYSMGLRDRTGPPKPVSTPHFATAHLAPAERCVNSNTKRALAPQKPSKDILCPWRPFNGKRSHGADPP